MTPRILPTLRRLALAIAIFSLGGCSLNELIGPMDLDLSGLESYRIIWVGLLPVDSSGVNGSGNLVGDVTAPDMELQLTLRNYRVAAGNLKVGEVYQGTLHLGASCGQLGEVVRALPAATGVLGTNGIEVVAATPTFNLASTIANGGYAFDYHTTNGGVTRRVACGELR